MNPIREIANYLRWVAGSLPGSSGIYIRRWLSPLRSQKPVLNRWARVEGAVSAGENLMLDERALLLANGGRAIVGRDVAIGLNSLVSACDGGEIIIGNDVLIAQNVVVRAADHRFDDLTKPIRAQGHVPGRIKIGNDVWIGANCVVTAGADIGDSSVIGAGAVVTGPIPPFSVAAGVPARVIRTRA